MAASTDTSPTVLGGRYVLHGLLGRGGAGEVYAGYDTVLERDVAVKVWRWPAGDVRAAHRLGREARAAGRLSGPNVVTVLDVDAAGDPPYLVMERLPGATWADVLRDAVPGDDTSAAVLADVLAALADAHPLGIVHRDVKPANVLLTADGRAKLGDFGIATAVDDTRLTRSGDVLGSAPYLAPERLHGTDATGACDVWSVGVMAYEAFSGRRPFEGDTPVAAALAVLHGDHAPLADLRPDLPPEVLDVVTAALAPEPAERPDAATFRSRLEAALPPTDGLGDPVLVAFVARDLDRRGDDGGPGSAGGPVPEGASATPALAGVALLERLVGLPAQRTATGRSSPRGRRLLGTTALVAAAALAGAGLGHAFGGGEVPVASARQPGPSAVDAALLPPPATPSRGPVTNPTPTSATPRPDRTVPARTVSVRVRDTRPGTREAKPRSAKGSKGSKGTGKGSKGKGKGAKGGKGKGKVAGHGHGSQQGPPVRRPHRSGRVGA